jgi:DNA-binding NtrC family response regulator
MPSQPGKTTIAVVNSSEDIVTMLRLALEDEGFATVAGHVPRFKSGHDDLLAFLQTHDPAVIVFDIAPPYADNWRFLNLVRDTRAAQGRAFVITTTNRARLEQEVGDTAAIEIVGKPFDLQEVVDAVRRALKQRAA